MRYEIAGMCAECGTVLAPGNREAGLCSTHLRALGIDQQDHPAPVTHWNGNGLKKSWRRGWQSKSEYQRNKTAYPLDS